MQSWQVTTSDGHQHLPYGESPQGSLVYTADGTVAVHMMVPDRQPLDLDSRLIARCRRIGTGTQADDPDDPELSEAKRRLFASAITFQAYSGSYVVEGDTVTHKVRLALWPEWVGTDLVRTFSFDGDELILSADNPGMRHELRWRRA